MVREKEIYSSSAPTLTFVRLLLPVGEAISAPPLSATLGQVQINSADFCKQFNTVSVELYDVGVLVNVHLFKNPDGTFYFYIRGVFLPFLMFQASDERRFIPVELLFDAWRIALPPTVKLDFFKAKELFGALRSMHFRVLL
jgi:hypothetical protein